MKNKKLLTTLGAVALLGAIGVGSTLAYLSDTTGTVTNTFTVGNVSFDDDNELGSGLRESKVERKDGVYVDADEADTWTVTKNDYKNLVAGETVYKDPTVIMAADSEVAWVFAQISNTNDTAFASIAWSEEWEKVDDLSTDDAVVYAKKTTIAAGEASTIFTSVTMADTITGDTEIPDIEVKAFAIQAAGFDSYADAISEVAFN